MSFRLAVLAGGVILLMGAGAGVRWWSSGSLAPVAPARLQLPEATPAGPSSAAVVSRRVGHAWGGWRVVREISIHRVVVMTIEAADLSHAQDIATLVVEPYQSDHFEALVYFVAPGAGDAPPFRIRWTPKTGFVHERF